MVKFRHPHLDLKFSVVKILNEIRIVVDVMTMSEKTFLYEEMKWPEIKEVAKEDRVVILPVVTIEDSELVQIFFNL